MGALKAAATEIAAKEAVRAIQARQLGAEAGQLSVADGGESGALSVAEGSAAPDDNAPGETATDDADGTQA